MQLDRSLSDHMESKGGTTGDIKNSSSTESFRLRELLHPESGLGADGFGHG